MRIAAMISRYLLGLIFVVFGLNGFFHFLPMTTLPGTAGQFLGAMVASGYVIPVFLLQVLGGLLLLSGRFVPLALVLLAPVIVNILIFHVTMAPQGIAPGIVVLVLWLLVYSSVRGAFAGILSNHG